MAKRKTFLKKKKKKKKFYCLEILTFNSKRRTHPCVKGKRKNLKLIYLLNLCAVGNEHRVNGPFLYYYHAIFPVTDYSNYITS